MRRMSKEIGVGTLICLAILLVGGIAHAQVPTVKGSGKMVDHFDVFSSIGNLLDEDVFVVPAGSRLIITDIVIGNSNDSPVCCARVFRNGSDLLYVGIPDHSSFRHSFISGIEFVGGDVLSLRNGDSSGPIRFFVSGYLTN